MRVALNLEQLLQPTPGGIGRYAAELARVLPTLAAGADPGADPGEVADQVAEAVEVVPFVARHPGPVVVTSMRAVGLGPATVLPWPRPLLYDLWNRWGRADPLRHLPAGAVDVVHAPSVAVPPRRRVPLVVTVHDAAPMRFPDTYPRRGRRFHDLGVRAAAARADAIVAPTAVAADEIAEFTPIPRERIVPIHHGVDHTVATDAEVAAARADLGLGDRPFVCWVGTLEPRKDVGVLIDAFARLVDRDDPPHRLVLVGPSGWLDGAGAAVTRAATLGDRVRFTGAVPADRLRALYRGAACFALPSRHEGFGLPVLEAAAQGTAVLASDLPVLREIAGTSARFVPVGDVEAWTDALGDVLRDDVARAALGAAGRARAAEFTWTRSARAHLAVYRSVC